MNRQQCGLWIAIFGLVSAAASGVLAAPDSNGLEELLATTTESGWSQSTIDSTRNVGTGVSIALATGSGTVTPFVSYYDTDQQDLWLARYVGGGGNCGPSSTWSCGAVDTTGNVGSHNAIAVYPDPNGVSTHVTIAYFDATGHSFKAASGWCGASSCTLVPYIVEAGNPGFITKGQYPSAAYDSHGNPHMAYRSTSSFGDPEVRYAQWIGNGTGNCGSGLYSGDWSCETVDIGVGLGTYISLDTDELFDPAGRGRPSIAYYDSVNGMAKVAQRSPTFGNCAIANEWSCYSVLIPARDTGTSTSLYLTASGTPHVAFLDSTLAELIYARFVASGGNCGASASGYQWQCDEIDLDVGLVGTTRTIDIVADPDGKPVIVYRDESSTYASGSVKTAQPLSAAPTGSVGNCGPSFTWVCSTLDVGGVGREEGTGVAIASNEAGMAIANHEYWIMSSEGNLKVLQYFFPLFADGFESGNTTAWTSVLP
jgi:hypothetical protein